VHFVALVNVADLKPGGMGNLGAEQLKWLKADLAGRSSSTPIVVFAHIPLWTVYADWGWGTDDAAEALKLLARFGSVTVLNGHIHQITQRSKGASPSTRRARRPSRSRRPARRRRRDRSRSRRAAAFGMLGITDAMFVRGTTASR
jgi:Icc protein